MLLSLSSWAGLPPVVSIIIDDIGYQATNDKQALALPGAITYAILPHTPGATTAIAEVIHSSRELMLHMPMEKSHSHHKAEAPGTLKHAMEWINFVRSMQANIAAVPGIVAVNNHEGSGLTADRERMKWFMQELSRHQGLAFIDSRTTHHTVALDTAIEHGIPATRRDVFLDYAPGKISQQFELLIETSKRQGTAVAIAHPNQETIMFLRENLPRLQQEGIRLVPISQILERRNQKIKTRRAHVQGVGTAR